VTETALALAARIRARQSSAKEAVAAALARIAAGDPKVNAFTAVLGDRALARAAAVDAAIARGEDPGPLAGVPFAAKNLFDLTGLPTLAGSIIRRTAPPAARDAWVVRRLEAAGAICVGALNMDEFAYGFTTENTHYGPTRNPHDPTRIAGGSSGGSGAAVAAGFVPLSLGTDTNGSIRVPASLNGLWAIKPSYGRLSRAGCFPFVHALDHVGPFARDVADLAAAYDALQGADPTDPAQADQPVELALPGLGAGLGGLRVAVLGGWFGARQSAAARQAVAAVAGRAFLGVGARLDAAPVAGSVGGRQGHRPRRGRLGTGREAGGHRGQREADAGGVEAVEPHDVRRHARQGGRGDVQAQHREPQARALSVWRIWGLVSGDPVDRSACGSQTRGFRRGDRSATGWRSAPEGGPSPWSGATAARHTAPQGLLDASGGWLPEISVVPTGPTFIFLPIGAAAAERMGELPAPGRS